MDITGTDRLGRAGQGAGDDFEPASATDIRHVATLRRRGLRPTRQRVAMMRLLFDAGGRHVSAEDVRTAARAAGDHLPPATVYNSLRQFVEVGLLREVATVETCCMFDTRTDSHHHFLVGETGEMVDIASADVAFARLPEPPEGMEIDSCEVTIRLRRKAPVP